MMVVVEFPLPQAWVETTPVEISSSKLVTPHAKEVRSASLAAVAKVTETRVVSF
jgi:hypothetical protein